MIEESNVSIETIRVPDISCIPLERIENGKGGFDFVEKPHYVIREVVTIEDDPVQINDPEPDKQIQEQKEDCPVEKQIKHLPKSKPKVRTLISTDKRSVMIKIIFPK